MPSSGQQRASQKYANMQADLRKRGQKRAAREKTKNIARDFQDVAFQKSEEVQEEIKGSKWGWLIPIALAVATGGQSLWVQALVQGAYAGLSTAQKNKKAKEILETAFTGEESTSLKSKYGETNMLNALTNYMGDIEEKINDTMMNPWKAALTSAGTTFAMGAATKGMGGSSSQLAAPGGQGASLFNPGAAKATLPSGRVIPSPDIAKVGDIGQRMSNFGTDITTFLEGLVTDFAPSEAMSTKALAGAVPEVAGQQIPFEGLGARGGGEGFKGITTPKGLEGLGHWNIGDVMQAYLQDEVRRNKIDAVNPWDVSGWQSRYHTRY